MYFVIRNSTLHFSYGLFNDAVRSSHCVNNTMNSVLESGSSIMWGAVQQLAQRDRGEETTRISGFRTHIWGQNLYATKQEFYRSTAMSGYCTTKHVHATLHSVHWRHQHAERYTVCTCNWSSRYLWKTHLSDQGNRWLKHVKIMGPWGKNEWQYEQLSEESR